MTINGYNHFTLRKVFILALFFIKFGIKRIKNTAIVHPISRGIWTESLKISKMKFKKASIFKYQMIFLYWTYLLPLIY